MEKKEDLVERGPLSLERSQSSCLKSTYFSYDGEFYEQRQGQPWDPLSLQ